MKTENKICKECKHCIKKYSGMTREGMLHSPVWLCKRITNINFNVVTGIKTTSEPLDCDQERSYGVGDMKHCGINGRFFEKKRTFMDWLKDLFKGGTTMTQTIGNNSCGSIQCGGNITINGKGIEKDEN